MIVKLTPKNVLQMIRDGVNPLEKTFGELESYFAENPQSYEEEAEDYSRFLYQLEQKKDITENERKAYIGIYRMVHQIEREDGAAVGAVVNIGAELQFSTLLAASRSRRTSHMDWKVSDDTGLTQEVRLSENNISEQISLASKEASGTGNMKFMLNGAITLGTMDGANVEIVNEVGAENAQIFGLSSDEVIRFENEGGYDPMEIFNILKDFRSYAEAQRKIDERYRDTNGWAKTVMTNTAKAGKFSSDRTIEEYAKEIWNLKKVKVTLD